MQRSSLVNNMGKVDPERSRRICGRAAPRWASDGVIRSLSRGHAAPNNRFDPSLPLRTSGVPPQLAGGWL
jgi:hypothetical protein